MKTTCAECESLILAELDNSMHSDQKAKLSAHLKDCAKCQVMRNEYSVLLKEIKEDVPPEPDSAFWRIYDQNLKAKLDEKRESGRWKFWNLAAGFAFTLIISIVGVHQVFLHAPIDRTTSIELIKDLNEVYGPVNNIMQADLSAISIDRQGDELLFDWFDVENENSTPLI